MFNLISALVLLSLFCLDAFTVEVITHDPGLFLSFGVNMNISLMAPEKTVVKGKR
jgi:hypothetical protein